MADNLLEIYKKHFKNIDKERKDDCLQIVLKNFMPIYTYDSVSFEGKNKMPFEDVKRLIRTEKTLKHSEREQKEVLNHQTAFLKVVALVESETPLTEELVKDIHELLTEDIQVGGIYRNVNIMIPGATHQPPDYVKVYDRMKKLFAYLPDFVGNKIEEAVYVHANIAKIHPFLDGNGKVARLVLNYYLMKAGYLPISIPIVLRDEYFIALEEYKINRDMNPLVIMVSGLIVEHFEEALDFLDDIKVKEE